MPTKNEDRDPSSSPTAALEQKATAETSRSMEDDYSEAPSDEEASYSMVMLEEATDSLEMQYIPETPPPPYIQTSKQTTNGLYAPRNHLDDGDVSTEESKSKKKPIFGLWKSAICLVMFAVVAAVVAGVVSTRVHERNNETQQQLQNDGNNESDVSPSSFDFNNLDPTSSPVVTDAPAAIAKTASPSSAPTDMLASEPSSEPTKIPTNAPQLITTTLPTKRPTRFPTPFPSPFPTTSHPTSLSGGSLVPSVQPTWAPFPKPPTTAIDFTSDTLLKFCVIADVPYNQQEARQLPRQIANQMQGCEFLVHLGDIFKTTSEGCVESRYTQIAEILRRSTIPVFSVLGDNEGVDCGPMININQGLFYWNTHLRLLDQEWDHSFNATRPSTRSETFSFVFKRTLLVGLNIVGGRVHDPSEWHARHSSQVAWIINELIPQNIPSKADGVILLAHARPSQVHEDFFQPLREYLQGVNFPVLYLHGDGHSFVYTPGFQGVSNLLAIQHEGGTRDPILKIHADPALLGPSVYSAFQFDRQLGLF